jgi:hypothetical protein
MRYGRTDAKAAWNELRFDQAYTLYPDGSVFISYSFDLGSLWPEKTLPAGKQRVNFLMRFSDDVNSAEAAARHAGDYRSPDRPAVATGAAEKSDEGDRDADGYNEEEGCYVLTSSAEGVAFTLHGKAVPRIHPAFKIKGWTGAAPVAIVIDGKAVPAVASVREGICVLQIDGIVKEDARVTIRHGGR